MAERITFRGVVTSQHLQNYETFVALFEKHARELAEETGEKGLVTTTVSRRQLDRWVSGEVKSLPRPRQCRVLERMLGHKATDLFASESTLKEEATTTFEEVQRSLALLDNGSEKSKEIVAELEGSDVGDWALTQIESESFRLLRGHGHLRAAETTPRLVSMVEQLGQYLLCTHRPSSLVRLHRSAGFVDALLARIAHDVGEMDVSLTYGRSAAWHAVNAEDDVLLAWVRCTQAQTAFWADDVSRSEFYTDLALAAAPDASDVQVWALNLKARALAFMDRHAEASELVERAVQTGNTSDEPLFGQLTLNQIFPFNEGLQLACEAQTRARLDPEARQSWAVAEEAVSTLGPPSGNEGQFAASSGATVTLALLNVRKGNFGEALKLIGPILATGEQQKVNGVTRALRALQSAVDQQPGDDPKAIKMSKDLRAFLDQSTARMYWA